MTRKLIGTLLVGTVLLLGLGFGSFVQADPPSCGTLVPWYVEVSWEGDGSPGLFRTCTEAEAKSAAADINLKGWRVDESRLIAAGALTELHVYESSTETRSYRAGGSGGGF